VQTVVRLSGCPTVRQSGCPAVRQSDSPAVRQSDSPAVRLSDSPAVRQSGSPTVRQSDSPAVRHSGSPTVRQSGSPAAGRHLHWPGYRLHCSPPLDRALSSNLSVRLAITQQTDTRCPTNYLAEKESVVMKYRHVNTSCFDVKCCAI